MLKFLGTEYEEYQRFNERCVNIYYEGDIKTTIWYDCCFNRIENIQSWKGFDFNGIMVYINY